MKKRVPFLVTMVLVVAMFLLTTQAFASQGTSVIPAARQPLTIHVGWVTEYVPGTSITIETSQGNFFTYALSASTRILPASRAAELAVCSRVTIISPNGDPAAGTASAAGIVVHPAGSGEGSAPADLPCAAAPTATPVVTETPGVTETPVVTETPGATETPPVTETPGVTETPPVTETPGGTITPTPGPGLIFPVAITTGLVTEYTPGASLTVQTADSLLHAFVLSPSLTILPAADQLMVGARVTVVAFHDSGTGNWVAFGIVVQSAVATPTPVPSPTP